MYFTGPKSSETSTTTTTQNYDQRQVNTTNNTLDGGAVQGIIDVAKASIGASTGAQVHAYDYADNIFSGAIDFANQNDKRAFNAFDRAATIQGDALVTLKSAYADAKGTSDSQKGIMYAALGVAAIFGLSAMQAKG